MHLYILIGKLITNCTNGWPLLTVKLFPRHGSSAVRIDKIILNRCQNFIVCCACLLASVILQLNPSLWTNADLYDAVNYKMHFYSYGGFHSVAACLRGKCSFREPMRVILLSASLLNSAHFILRLQSLKSYLRPMILRKPHLSAS